MAVLHDQSLIVNKDVLIEAVLDQAADVSQRQLPYLSGPAEADQERAPVLSSWNEHVYVFFPQSVEGVVVYLPLPVLAGESRAVATDSELWVYFFLEEIVDPLGVNFVDVGRGVYFDGVLVRPIPVLLQK